MSNEDLAKRIQDGEAEAVLQLWENVRKFIHLQAYRYHVFSGGEIEDLEQAGFIAMLDASRKYDPGRESSFIHYLASRIRGEFKKTLTGNLARAKSLNDPIDEDGNTLADILPDPVNPYEKKERRIYLEQLRQQLNTELSTLPEEQRDIIKRLYFAGSTRKQAADALRLREQDIRRGEQKALAALRKRKELEQFIDDLTPFYYVDAETCVIRREEIRKRCNNGFNKES